MTSLFLKKLKYPVRLKFPKELFPVPEILTKESSISNLILNLSSEIARIIPG